MIDLFKVHMNRDADQAVVDVLHSGYITQGPMVDRFEEKLSNVIGPTGLSHSRPILVNSCTSAIDLAFELCGVGPGDEVISTPQTCFASNVGIIHRGARIRWADIDPLTGLIDPESISRRGLVNEKTKAIIAVNWAGKFVDYKALKEYGVPVIEDAAHTWDSFIAGGAQPARGDYVCYSLQAIKFLTSGDGGILFTPKQQENEARLLRWYGLDRTRNESFRITQNIKQAGFKYNMNDIAAAIGIQNIPNAKSAVHAHRNNARTLCKYIDNEHLTVLPFDETASYWIFPVLVNDAGQREAFRHYLQDNMISAALVHYRNDKYDSTLEFAEGVLPGVDYFTEHQLNLPCGWWLDAQEIFYIIDVVNRWKPNA